MVSMTVSVLLGQLVKARRTPQCVSVVDLVPLAILPMVGSVPTVLWVLILLPTVQLLVYSV